MSAAQIQGKTHNPQRNYQKRKTHELASSNATRLSCATANEKKQKQNQKPKRTQPIPSRSSRSIAIPRRNYAQLGSDSLQLQSPRAGRLTPTKTTKDKPSLPWIFNSHPYSSYFGIKHKEQNETRQKKKKIQHNNRCRLAARTTSMKIALTKRKTKTIQSALHACSSEMEKKKQEMTQNPAPTLRFFSAPSIQRSNSHNVNQHRKEVLQTRNRTGKRGHCGNPGLQHWIGL